MYETGQTEFAAGLAIVEFDLRLATHSALLRLSFITLLEWP
ncbi:hypothetical protein COLO4_32042 [Corchorus olitorius]|uniref:Uncharacterized protein n=1 Tax=Corchorus olitorius TaxID=93759 RepID=A0A1R3H2E0_9ROSI|nr:hypothetical protein COLO4_32042 [Corchorus olitorius]